MDLSLRAKKLQHYHSRGRAEFDHHLNNYPRLRKGYNISIAINHAYPTSAKRRVLIADQVKIQRTTQKTIFLKRKSRSRSSKAASLAYGVRSSSLSPRGGSEADETLVLAIGRVQPSAITACQIVIQ